MEELNDQLNAIIALVMLYDKTWRQLPSSNDTIVICNSRGQQIHAPTLLAAFEGALALHIGVASKC
jgi:hypothetical protein